MSNRHKDVRIAFQQLQARWAVRPNSCGEQASKQWVLVIYLIATWARWHVGKKNILDSTSIVEKMNGLEELNYAQRAKLLAVPICSILCIGRYGNSVPVCGGRGDAAGLSYCINLQESARARPGAELGHQRVRRSITAEAISRRPNLRTFWGPAELLVRACTPCFSSIVKASPASSFRSRLDCAIGVKSWDAIAPGQGLRRSFLFVRVKSSKRRFVRFTRSDSPAACSGRAMRRRTKGDALHAQQVPDHWVRYIG